MNGEQLVTLGEATAFFPVKTAKRAVWRWATIGSCVRGQWVRLDSVRVGGRFFTSAEAVARFLAKLAQLSIDAPGQGIDGTVSTRTPVEREQAMDRAKQRLAASGL